AGMDVPNAVRYYAERVRGDIAQEMLAVGHATTETASGACRNSRLREHTPHEGEVGVVGSSRLAVRGGLFISSKASRILRSIPVPMIVVPAGYMKADESPGSSTPPSPRKDDEL